MDTAAALEPQPLDLSLQLPRDVYHQLIHRLRPALAAISASPEDLVRRDNAAIALIASLLPANAEEAALAAQFAIASALAMDFARPAQEYARSDPTLALKYGAQALSMMREARGARSLLLRVQATRQKREADPSALGKAAWLEHCLIGLMAEALGRTPPAPVAEPPPPAPEPTPDAEPEPDVAAETDQYALIYPRRARLIRQHQGLPPNCSFGPPPDYIQHGLINGRSPILLALDQEADAEALPA